MATQFPNVDELEQAAAYRPSVGANILNLLTGGIYGGVTGKSQKAMEAAAARQMLLQERAQERGMERALFRNKMQTALEEGLQIPEGARKEDLDALIQQNRIKRLREELRGFTGSEPAENLSVGELQGQLTRARTEAPQTAAMRLSGQQARAMLGALQGQGAFPTPMDTSRIPDEQAIAQSKIAQARYEQSIKTDASQRQELREIAAIDDWRKATEAAVPDQKKLSEIFPRLPDAYQKSPEIRAQVGLLDAISKDERKELNNLLSDYSKGISIIGSVQKLVGDKDYNDVSAMNFNSFDSWRRGKGQTLFKSTPEWAQMNEIVQEFEDYMSGKRKTLFGASLTGNELASAERLFGNPNAANFLPTLIGILDRQFSKDVIAESYDPWGMYIPRDVRKSFGEKRKQYFEMRGKLRSPSLGDVRQGQEPAAPAAPAPQPTRPDGTNAISQQLQLIGNRINELKSRKSTNIVNPLNK
jgi:hypothetical protein